MADATAPIKKIYDLQTIGVTKVLSDLQRVNDQLEKIKKTKQILNQDKAEAQQQLAVAKLNTELAKEQSAIAKLNSELTKQQTLEEKLSQQKIKNEQEVIRLVNLEAKAEENRLKVIQKAANVKPVATAAKDVPFTSNVSASGKIIDPTAVTNATNAISKLDDELLQAQLSASAWAASTRVAGTEVRNTSKAVVDNSKELALNKKIQVEQKYLDGERARLLKAQVREENNLKGSLEQRRAALIRLNAAYDKLSPKERDTSWGLRLKKTIADLTVQVKGLESATGRDQRNVGNYGSAWEGASKKFTKAFGALRTLANILPGIGIGGLVGLGIEGIIALANAMNLLETATEAEKAQMKEFAEEHDKMISTIAEETSTLQTLYTTATNTNVSYRERGKAVDELINLYPDYFTELNREKLLNGELSDSYALLTAEIKKRAEATALQTRLSKLYEKKIDLELELGRIQGSNSANEFYYSNKRAEDLQAELNNQNTLIDLTEKRIQKGKEGFGNDIYFIDAKTKKEYDAQMKLDKLRAEKGKPKKAKKERDDTEKEQLESDRIINEARLNLLDDQAREIMVRTQKHDAELKKLRKVSAADRKAFEESFHKDLLEINRKYAKMQEDLQMKHLKELDKEVEDMNDKAFDNATDAIKRGIEIDEAKEKNRQKEKNLIKKNLEEIQEYVRDAEEKRTKKEKEEEEKRRKLRQMAMNGALDLAQQYADAQIQLENQVIDKRYEEAFEFQNIEKQKHLDLATSKAEEQAIENEYRAKEKELERQRNIERQEVARKQLTIEFALASIKAISTSSNIYEGLIKEGIVIGQYLIALNNLNNQKFEQGGQVPTSTGGDITGPSHAAGGVGFNFEAQGGEMAIVNKNSTFDSGTYNVTGTPRQIASAINTIGGGVQFAPGAKTQRFEYGGMLGSNLSAPIYRAYYSDTSSGGNSDLILQSIISTNQRIDNLKVTLDTKGLSKSQSQSAKQKSIAQI